MSSQDASAVPEVPSVARPRSTATLLLCGGVAILLFGVYLYVTDLSRAIVVWTSPLGAAMLVVGAWSQRTERPAPRWLLLLIGLVALTLLGLGLTTLIYALQAVDTAA